FPGRQARPLGVAGEIIPWDFPLLMGAGEGGPALARGNTGGVETAEKTGIKARQVAESFQGDGQPGGGVNIVTGAGETGAAIVNHPELDKIAFTGSTEVGKMIAKRLAERAGERHAPKLTLELGGKAANIVFEDAPIEQAIEGVIAGIYFN